MSFKPTATKNVLMQRAEIMKKIRKFFERRNYLEVETPILSNAAVTDINLESFASVYDKKNVYLNTSPEFHMKRLLASRIGPIFQICKAFRQGESGQFHNPEFTILEWYKPGFDHFKLMAEIEDFINHLLGKKKHEYRTFQQLFLEVLDIDLDSINDYELAEQAWQYGLDSNVNKRDECIDFLMVDIVESYIKKSYPRLFVYNYPKSQAALATLDKKNPNYANRFELYINGIEICNGFNELCDANEQLKRFKHDIKIRKSMGKESSPFDKHLISALESGMPQSAGVALGLDRLMMILLDKASIQDVITFPIEIA